MTPYIYIALAAIALPLWLLVRIGARLVNAVQDAKIPLREIASLHYALTGAPEPSVLAAQMAEKATEELGGIQAAKGSIFNPFVEDENEP